MIRLTNRDFNYDPDFVASHLQSWSIAEALKKLQQYENDEEDGRLVALPVPIGPGKLAYVLADPDAGSPDIETIECDSLDKLEIWDNPCQEVVVHVDGWEIGQSNVGKTVFLTHEEAEAALKKMKGE